MINVTAIKVLIECYPEETNLIWRTVQPRVSIQEIA